MYVRYFCVITVVRCACICSIGTFRSKDGQHGNGGCLYSDYLYTILDAVECWREFAADITYQYFAF